MQITKRKVIVVVIVVCVGIWFYCKMSKPRTIAALFMKNAYQKNINPLNIYAMTKITMDEINAPEVTKQDIPKQNISPEVSKLLKASDPIKKKIFEVCKILSAIYLQKIIPYFQSLGL